MRGVVSMKQVADPRSLRAFCKQRPEGSKPLAAYRSPQFQRRQSRVNGGDLIPTEIHERNDLRRPLYRECNSRILLLVPLEPLSHVRGGARSRDQIRRSAA